MLPLGLLLSTSALAASLGALTDLQVSRFLSQTELIAQLGSTRKELSLGGVIGKWTLVGVTAGEHEMAVFEDFQQQDGHVLFVDSGGVRLDMPKTAESATVESSSLYLGYSADEVRASPSDLLGMKLLGRNGDPDYDTIAGVLPPLADLHAGNQEGVWLDFDKPGGVLEGFVGTPDTFDKIYFSSGGASPNFDPISLQPGIGPLRKAGHVLYGLMGGWTPALRFVYPEAGGSWTELIAFAPFRIVNANKQFQPVWYRVTHVEHDRVQWIRYIDSVRSFILKNNTEQVVEDAPSFYSDLWDFQVKWKAKIDPGLRIDVPDSRIENMARFGLVASMMTESDGFPKYGIPTEPMGAGYGASQHDGFQDTFTVRTAEMIGWGLLSEAEQYIDNYLSKFVLDDGRILYRGLETGQYCRMLTVLAQYLNAGGDPRVLIDERHRIEGIVGLILRLRDAALAKPSSDPTRGLLVGPSEADGVLRPDPWRYMQPYISNSAEAVRAFQDFGDAWRALGMRTRDTEMQAVGERLSHEAVALRADLSDALAHSEIREKGGGPGILPAIAGVSLAADAATDEDGFNPQWEYYRVFMEALSSGILSDPQSDKISNFLANHHGLRLGMPASFVQRTQLTFGFLSQGYAYDLMRRDRIREFLLMLYSEMAHQYTRGTWFASEERDPLSPEWMEYSVVAQLTIPAMVRSMLVFEEPETNVLWLGKGVPRQWLADGKSIAVRNAPTKWGRVSYQLQSHLHAGRITGNVTLPAEGLRAETKLRVRINDDWRIQSVTVNGKAWQGFDSDLQVITLPKLMAGTIEIVARCTHQGRRSRS